MEHMEDHAAPDVLPSAQLGHVLFNNAAGIGGLFGDLGGIVLYDALLHQVEETADAVKNADEGLGGQGEYREGQQDRRRVLFLPAPVDGRAGQHAARDGAGDYGAAGFRHGVGGADGDQRQDQKGFLPALLQRREAVNAHHQEENAVAAGGIGVLSHPHPKPFHMIDPVEKGGKGEIAPEKPVKAVHDEQAERQQEKIIDQMQQASSVFRAQVKPQRERDHKRRPQIEEIASVVIEAPEPLADGQEAGRDRAYEPGKDEKKLRPAEPFAQLPQFCRSAGVTAGADQRDHTADRRRPGQGELAAQENDVPGFPGREEAAVHDAHNDMHADEDTQAYQRRGTTLFR